MLQGTPSPHLEQLRQFLVYFTAQYHRVLSVTDEFTFFTS